MSTHPHPKSIPGPHRPAGAEQPPPGEAAGAPGVAAEGVAAALRPDPQPGDGRQATAWLHIIAPPSYRATPRARSWCLCGRDARATGPAAVAALVTAHRQHADACPVRNPQEGRAAA